MTIMYPLLPFYAEHHGAGPLGAGLLISVYALCQLFGGPLLGRLSDRTGRKPLLFVSQIGTLFGFVLLAFANSLWLIFVSRIIDGITAGNISLAQAYIADVTKPEERTKSFAVIGIAFGVGFLIGPAISGYLAQFSYQISRLCGHGAFGNEHSGHGRSSSRTQAVCERRRAASQCPRLGHLCGILPPARCLRLLWQFFAFMFCFSLFMSGFPLVCRTPVHVGRPCVRAEGSRLRLCVCRRLGVFCKAD